MPLPRRPPSSLHWLRPSPSHGRHLPLRLPSSSSALRLQSQLQFRKLSTDTATSQPQPPQPATSNAFQKDHKAQLKARTSKSGKQPAHASSSALQWGGPDGEWDLIVGLEFHAQLNTTRKLFSDAKTSINESPNTHVALFDAALPGTQPIFQGPTLLPALRAAMALNCDIQKESRFDRKHYFYWDQPGGYQITQFYHPLARQGHLTILPSDTFDPLNPTTPLLTEPFTIGIHQIQLEQDTAKTITTPSLDPSLSSATHLIDLNRVSHPLIEIITTPCIPTPHLCALTLRKIQALLKSTGTTIIGMEWGGLRCDVNVSVKPRGKRGEGTLGLGQRVEIKNLSSGRAVEKAVEYEALRQVAVISSGGKVLGETRGWEEGDTENGGSGGGMGRTVRLRAKEGETDYRYMPDPDIPPVRLSQSLLDHVRRNMPMLPDKVLEMLVGEKFGLTTKDANTLMAWDNGERVGYYLDVVKRVTRALEAELEKEGDGESVVTKELIDDVGRMVGNWVVHTLPAALASATAATSPAHATLIPGMPPPHMPVPNTVHQQSWATNPPLLPVHLAGIIAHLLSGKITLAGSKTLLSHSLQIPSQEDIDIPALINQLNLTVLPLPTAELLAAMAEIILSENAAADVVKMREQWVDVRNKMEAEEQAKKKGALEKKLGGLRNWFVGKVVRELGGRVDAKRVEGVVGRVLERAGRD